jgi:hypothetical protein
LARIFEGESVNAASSAMVTMLGVLVAKHCKTETEAVVLCAALSGDFTRNALEFMRDGHHAA